LAVASQAVPFVVRSPPACGGYYVHRPGRGILLWEQRVIPPLARLRRPPYRRLCRLRPATHDLGSYTYTDDRGPLRLIAPRVRTLIHHDGPIAGRRNERHRLGASQLFARLWAAIAGYSFGWLAWPQARHTIPPVAFLDSKVRRTLA